MVHENRYSPFTVQEETADKLHLRLNTASGFLHLFTTLLLPAIIVSVVLVSAFLLYHENNTELIWPLVIILPVPVMMAMVPAWTAIIASPGYVEVHYKKLFRTHIHRFQLHNNMRIEAHIRNAYRSAGWVFSLNDNQGNRTHLFTIPSLPYNNRAAEKDNLLRALQQYCQLPESGQ